MAKTRVLVVGATGYIGKRIVAASLTAGHRTFVLCRREIGLDIDKLQTLLHFKKQGATILHASFADRRSLVDAVKQVDVVISAMSGVHFRSHNLLMQLELVKAIEEAGNVKRFLPSEFGLDPGRMGHSLAPGRVTFDEKMVVRRAIKEANIPHTYVVANCFGGYFAGNLSQMGALLPPENRVFIYGSGDVKTIFMDEDDVATYTVMAIDDPRTLNKTLHIRPKENFLTQRELVAEWEKVSGKSLEKTPIPEEDFLARLNDADTVFAEQVGICHFYHIFYQGSSTNFELGEDDVEASSLYPQVKYKRMHEYLKQYV